MFFDKLKDKFDQLVNKIYSSFLNFRNKILPAKTIALNSENIRIYHHSDFSYIFIDIDIINLLCEEEFDFLLSYLINSIKIHLDKKDTSLINIISKIIFKDDLGIIYTHSLTYNILFTLKDLDNWQTIFKRDIRELLNQYNDSKIQALEFRFDYIHSGKLKTTKVE